MEKTKETKNKKDNLKETEKVKEIAKDAKAIKEEKKQKKERKEKESKKEKKAEKTKASDKKSFKESFFKSLEEKFFETATFFLKKGVVSMALKKIDDVENQVKEKMEERFNFYKNKSIFIISALIASIFLVYGLVQNLFMVLDLERFTNIFFGLIFGIVALVFYQSEK